MKISLLIVVALLAPKIAGACDKQDRLVFACTVSGDALKKPAPVEVCQGPSAMSLSFDKGGPNELRLTGPNATVREYAESNASGNNNTFFFLDSDTNKWHIVDHMADPIDGHLYTAMLTIRDKNAEFGATYSCDDASVRFDEKAIKARANEAGSIPRFHGD